MENLLRIDDSLQIDEYIKNYDTFEIKIVYHFDITDGGIGDCISFFMYLLDFCIKQKYKLYYRKNNIPIEKYLKLKYSQMYIERNKIYNTRIITNIREISNLHPSYYYIIKPHAFYKIENIYSNLNTIQTIFDFSEEVKLNRNNILPENISNYISIHLRLGDKFLEIPKSTILCLDDERKYDENKIVEYIQENYNENLIFFCDNQAYKLKIKQKFPNVIITNSQIAHTSYINTTKKQVLDTITEFYIMTESKKMIAASMSGFSIIASKFKNISIIYL